MKTNHATYLVCVIHKSWSFNRLAKSWSTQFFPFVHPTDDIPALLNGGHTCLFIKKCMNNCHTSFIVHSSLNGNIGWFFFKLIETVFVKSRLKHCTCMLP